MCLIVLSSLLILIAKIIFVQFLFIKATEHKEKRNHSVLFLYIFYGTLLPVFIYFFNFHHIYKQQSVMEVVCNNVYVHEVNKTVKPISSLQTCSDHKWPPSISFSVTMNHLNYLRHLFSFYTLFLLPYFPAY